MNPRINPFKAVIERYPIVAQQNYPCNKNNKKKAPNLGPLPAKAALDPTMDLGWLHLHNMLQICVISSPQEISTRLAFDQRTAVVVVILGVKCNTSSYERNIFFLPSAFEKESLPDSPVNRVLRESLQFTVFSIPGIFSKNRSVNDVQLDQKDLGRMRAVVGES